MSISLSPLVIYKHAPRPHFPAFSPCIGSPQLVSPSLHSRFVSTLPPTPQLTPLLLWSLSSPRDAEHLCQEYQECPNSSDHWRLYEDLLLFKRPVQIVGENNNIKSADNTAKVIM